MKWYSPKMAASVLKRCVTAAVKVKGSLPTYAARRWLLSSAYSDTKLWESRETEPQNLALLANFMDRTYTNNLPVSSLVMSRFIDNISSREEVDQAEYYLYKFRHSPNCWYLRVWTVHCWIRKCLKYGARDKALYTLKNKVQYGIFPDDFTFNLLLDSYIKDGDFKGAFSVVEEVMLQEAFDRPSTLILSLHVLASYLATKPLLTESEQRAMGASLLLSGLKVDSSLGLSAQLMGNALLGKLELSKGVHAVFKGMPLMWTYGYLDRALDVLDKVAAAPADVKLPKDALDVLSDVLQDLSSASDSDSSGGEESAGEEEEKEKRMLDAVDDEDAAERAKLLEYADRFKELRSQLESEGKVDSTSFHALVSALAQQDLPAAELSDVQEYESNVPEWEKDRKYLIQREKEARAQAEKEREERRAASAAAAQQ